jgi:methylphosphotriester-DNA--protein-cysteine methyltransferase
MQPSVLARAEPQSPNAPTPSGNSDGKIIGNKNSKIYHLPGCSSYNKVSEKNQIKFDTAQEAEQAGYRLAGNCSSNKSAKQ